MVTGIAAHREFHTRLAVLDFMFIKRHATCETLNAVNIKLLISNHPTYQCYVTSRKMASKNGDNPAVFTLQANPPLIVGRGYGSETHLHIHFITFEKEILHNVA